MTAITTATCHPDPQRFPPGTVVGAYKPTAWSGRDHTVAPTGAADTTATVQADGTLSFAGLTDQTAYFGYAAGSGAFRFSTRHDYADDVTAALVGTSSVDATNYGADASGVADSTTALRNAWAAAQARTTDVVLQPGTYTVSGRIHSAAATSDPVRFRAAIPGTVTIQRTADVPIIEVTGSRSAAVALTANAAIGATSVTVASLPLSLAVDDFIVLRSDALLTPTGLAKTSEVLRVKTIAGSGPYTITFYGPTEEQYLTASNATIQRLSLVQQPQVSGIAFRQTAMARDTATNGLVMFNLCRRVRVDGVVCKDADAPGITFNSCIDSDVQDFAAENLTDDIPNNRIGYGINVAGECQDIRIARPTGRRIRHTVTTNSDAATGAPRHVRVTRGVASQCTSMGFDTHKEGKHVTFEDCTVHQSFGGFQSRSPFTTWRNCTAISCTDYGFNVYTSDGVDCRLLNCAVIGSAAMAQQPLIVEAARFTADGLLIDGPMAGGTGYPIWVEAAGSTIRKLVVRNATLTSGYLIRYEDTAAGAHTLDRVHCDATASGKNLAHLGLGVVLLMLGQPTGTAFNEVSQWASNAWTAGGGTIAADPPVGLTFVPGGSLAIGDKYGTYIGNSAGANRTYQLPEARSRLGRRITFIKQSSTAELYTITTSNAQTINGAATFVLTAQYDKVTVQSNGANWLIV
jgi:hypothetical protein